MWGPKWFALRHGKYKLIGRPADGTIKYQLFDIEADPGEKTDVQGLQPEIGRRFAANLQLLLKTMRAQRGASKPADISAAEHDQLCSLGYIECDQR